MQIPVEVLEELEVVKAEDPTEVFKAIEIIEDKPKKPRKSRKTRTTKKTEDSTDVEVLDQPRAKEKPNRAKRIVEDLNTPKFNRNPDGSVIALGGQHITDEEIKEAIKPLDHLVDPVPTEEILDEILHPLGIIEVPEHLIETHAFDDKLGLEDPEEIETLIEPDNYVPQESVKVTNTGKLFLVYAKTLDLCVGLITGTGKKRCPFINFSFYFASIATWSQSPNKVLILGTNAYKELLEHPETIPGVQLVVISSQKGLVKDSDILQFEDMRLLENHIKVATAIGMDVFINTGPELLGYFAQEADGEFVLTTYQNSKEILRGKEQGIFYHSQQHPTSTKLIADGVPVRNVSRTPCKVEFNQFK